MMIVLAVLGAYVVLGAVAAVAFILFGVARVVPHAVVTPGARIMLLPGAFALWPFVLRLWIKSPRPR